MALESIYPGSADFHNARFAEGLARHVAEP
jgi:hypothetical protein